MKDRGDVFISYSHADAKALTRLRVHLRPFERLGQLSVWSDQLIKPGTKWREEIHNALERCRVAILLISADFLASDFIAENELPPLLTAAQSRGVKVIPVVLRPCAFEDVVELGAFQSITDPRKPLEELDDNEQERAWVDVARCVRDALVKLSPADHSEGPGTDDWTKWSESDVMYGIDLPETIKEYIVYHYEHVDVLGFMRSAEDVLRGNPRQSDYIQAIRQRFLDAGWEGDGVIRAIWFPPFVGPGVEDTFGVAGWFVKQSNNGTSFIASPVELKFPRLLEQQY